MRDQKFPFSCLDIRGRFYSSKTLQEFAVPSHVFLIFRCSDSFFDLLADVPHLGLSFLLPSVSCAAAALLHQSVLLFAQPSSLSCAAAQVLLLLHNCQ